MKDKDMDEQAWSDLDGNRVEPDDLAVPPRKGLPYTVPHADTFPERGILASVPFDFIQDRWRRKLTELTAAYEGLNKVLEAALETGHVRLGAVGLSLTKQEKKAVNNWVQNGKPSLMPVQVTILGRDEAKGLLLTKEYGALPVVDLDQVPELAVAFIYRFATANGPYFRLGWRRQDIGRKLRAPKAKPKPDSSQS